MSLVLIVVRIVNRLWYCVNQVLLAPIGEASALVRVLERGLVASCFVCWIVCHRDRSANFLKQLVVEAYALISIPPQRLYFIDRAM